MAQLSLTKRHLNINIALKYVIIKKTLKIIKLFFGWGWRIILGFSLFPGSFGK